MAHGWGKLVYEEVLDSEGGAMGMQLGRPRPNITHRIQYGQCLILVIIHSFCGLLSTSSACRAFTQHCSGDSPLQRNTPGWTPWILMQRVYDHFYFGFKEVSEVSVARAPVLEFGLAIDVQCGRPGALQLSAHAGGRHVLKSCKAY